MKLTKPAVASVALIVWLAIGIVAVGSAAAAPKTVPIAWKVVPAGGEPHNFEEPTSKNISAAKTVVFQSEIGTTPLKIEMASAECVSCSIYNESGLAKGKGTIRFKHAIVASPAACKLWSEEEIITEPMKTDGTYRTSLNTWTFLEPATAETPLIEFKLVKGSGSCPIEGNYKVTGNLFMEWANPPGVYATTQSVSTSAAINAEGGGSLSIGSKAASLTGTLNLTDEGKTFGVG
jgi:hypothetical protein